MAQTPRSSRRRTPVEEASSPAPVVARSPSLKPETRHGILTVFVLTGAAVSALSIIGAAGLLGTYIAQALGTLFGWQRYIIPIYLAVLGIVLLFPERWHVATSRWAGFLLTLISSLALLQQFIPVADSFRQALAGRGGGYIGALLDYPLRSSLGPWAGGLILLGLFVAGLLIMLNTTLVNLLRQGNIAGRLLQSWRAWVWRRRLAKSIPQEEQNEADPEFKKKDIQDDDEDAEPSDEELDLVPIAPKPAKRVRRTISIPLDVLDGATSQPTSGNIEDNKTKIQRTLQNFGINVEMGEIHVGPTVTQYTLKPAEGVKLSQITGLNNDLALALAAHPIRIEAPIPGKSLVGIEVPNKSVATVRLREILASDIFRQRQSNLTFSIGKDVSGQPAIANLDPLPHLLIAGATGSGKSVMVNGLIISLLYSNSPDDLKFILVDPKRVELSVYNGIPHLLTPVITDTTKTINALRWVVGEMDRRYSILSQAGKRNIGSYRQDNGLDMPYIVLIIDELADLMSVAANEVEGAIVRLAQMARAVGIHLVLATQRPSVDVITGLIKANVTARMAFNVASQIDSRTILDSSGAEKLLGKGDLLFISAELSKPKRFQGAYVSEQEVERVVQFLKARAQPDYMNDIVDKPSPALGQSLEDLGDDELLAESKEVIIQAGKASASLLQRRLRVGYARAARILDLLEKEGFIGPGEGAKPREVFGEQVGLGTDQASEPQATSAGTSDEEDPESGARDENPDDADAPPDHA
ncbi:MAG: DNA translocase FtsK [Candidatus Kerfeldbacteria bacterium]|nr:DNA translocase FtsK [Candidatus Kerfeldbacteria bacterium]